MPSPYRLSASDLRTFRPERKAHGRFFSLGMAQAAHAGVAIVVSKKIARHAVDRNLIKRRLRAALGPLLPRLAPGRYVFYAKSAAAGATLAEIRQDAGALCAHAGA